MNTSLITKTHLETMYDKANAIGILPFIQSVAFTGNDEQAYAVVTYMKPRQRKPKELWHFFSNGIFCVEIRRRQRKIATTK